MKFESIEIIFGKKKAIKITIAVIFITSLGFWITFNSINNSKENIEKTFKDGAKIYAYHVEQNREDKEFGIIFDEMIQWDKFYMGGIEEESQVTNLLMFGKLNDKLFFEYFGKSLTGDLIDISNNMVTMQMPQEASLVMDVISIADAATNIFDKGFEFSEKSLKMKSGEVFQLQAEYNRNELDSSSVIWASYNPKIATVKDGGVIAHSKGKTEIGAFIIVDGAITIQKIDIEVE